MKRTLALSPPVPAALRTEVGEKLAYASEHLRAFRLSDDGAALELEVDDAHADEAAGKAGRMVAQLVKGFRPVETEVLWRTGSPSPPRPSPWDELRERRVLFAEGPGQISFAGEAVVAMEALDRRFQDIATRFAATPQQYPTLLSMAAMDRSHYFASFPQHVTFAPHLRDDVDSLTDVQARPEHGDYPFLEHLVPPRHVLSPALCYHAYVSHADRPLEQLGGPQTLTARGRCFRWESRNLATLERLWDFSMRELIFIGPRAFVESQRERAVAETRALVDALALDASLETANDPFFLNNFVAARFFQLMTRTKYELRLALPYSGGSLAAASFNLHNEFFGSSFAISLDGAPAFTGCVGYGLERWLWALYAQHGSSIAAWPATARRTLEL